jgi:hypothetical protein
MLLAYPGNPDLLNLYDEILGVGLAHGSLTRVEEDILESAFLGLHMLSTLDSPALCRLLQKAFLVAKLRWEAYGPKWALAANACVPRKLLAERDRSLLATHAAWRIRAEEPTVLEDARADEYDRLSHVIAGLHGRAHRPRDRHVIQDGSTVSVRVGLKGRADSVTGKLGNFAIDCRAPFVPGAWITSNTKPAWPPADSNDLWRIGTVTIVVSHDCETVLDGVRIFGPIEQNLGHTPENGFRIQFGNLTSENIAALNLLAARYPIRR